MKLAVFLKNVLIFSLGAEQPALSETLVQFDKQVLSERFFSEGACFADIDRDGDADIVSGPYWYEGPQFEKRHAYEEPLGVWIKAYSNFFFTFAHDFNNDQRPDILAIPMPGQAAHWYENPGATAKAWQKHLALTDVGNESPHLTDLTGDGQPELICCRGGKIGYAEPNWTAPTEPWKFTEIADRGYGRFTHGLGIGDIDQDGHMDVLEKNGWWEQRSPTEFQFHAVKFAGPTGGAQMFAHDFDGDGDNDVISSQNAHGWGLTWFEQSRDAQGGIQFSSRPIMTANAADNPYGLAISQMHALALADIDGDGLQDVVTGKRFYAHGGNDPGAHESPVLYWFRTLRSPDGVAFEPWKIDDRSGVGTQLTVGDVTGDGHPDVVIGNKLGTYVMRQQRQTISAADYEDRRPVKRANPLHVVGTDLFASHIRTTDPLTAEQALDSFILPDGFEIQLVAAEPDIDKPLNMAFDAKGRLWVTTTLEYPYPAPADRKGRDSIKVLSDTNGDGRADEITTFADGLNIPMGLYPYRDGVICFSIPNIWFLRDTDGDGKCDRREKLYGPLGYERDTHGMCNSFTRYRDGWLYATHGFNNITTLSGTDGHEIHMQSGNIFRMRVDGSRVEMVTRGLVNPFGMVFAPNGDLFAADCHTKPVSLIVPGGYHESFGKPHDGLGFIPNMMEHLHGSTAICGLALGSATAFPDGYRSSIFSGNVTTCRINQNRLHYQGSSPHAEEEPDFLVSSDPWFRPVDLQVGPDGALYVADFYNRIIGHYEVPLDDPGRDRHRGRIWRIVHQEGEHSMPDLSKASLENLTEALKSPLSTRAELAFEQMVERIPNHHANDLWVRFRLNQLQAREIELAVSAASPEAREKAFRLLAAMENLDLSGSVSQGLKDDHPAVQRAAALAASRHPSEALLTPLLDALTQCPQDDVQLRYALRLALRNHLRDEAHFQSLKEIVSNGGQAAELASICLAVKSPASAGFLIEHLDQIEEVSTEELGRWLAFAVEHAPVAMLDKVVEVSQARFTDDTEFQAALLESVHGGLQKRRVSIPASITGWATNVADDLLGLDDPNAMEPLAWSHLPFPGQPDEGKSWVLSTNRDSADGRKQTPLWSSFVLGERRTGIAQSAVFQITTTPFQFYLAGHDGPPGRPHQGKNLVRLVDATSHELLRTAAALRDDQAQLISWDTKDLMNRKVRLELVDGDAGNAFAWLAAGRFSDSRLNPSAWPKRRRLAAELIGKFQLREKQAVLVALMGKDPSFNENSYHYAKAFSKLLAQDPILPVLAEILQVRGADRALREQVVQRMLQYKENAPPEPLLKAAFNVATAAEQTRIASSLLAQPQGPKLLLELVTNGSAPDKLLNQPGLAPTLDAYKDDAFQEHLAAIRGQLPSDDGERRKLIASRIQSYRRHSGDPVAGLALFQQHCQICHRIAGEGSPLGPNLDGLGNRGLDRVVEDILDPNRNVDHAFRIAAIELTDGRTVTGFVRAKDNSQWIVADAQGQEQTIARPMIAKETPSRISLMPDTFGQVLDDASFRNLVRYLLTLR